MVLCAWRCVMHVLLMRNQDERNTSHSAPVEVNARRIDKSVAF
jgi:hypothetical protein